MWRCIQRLNSAVYGVTPPETAAAVPSSKIVAPPPNQDSSLCEMETELRMRRRRRFVDAAAADHNQGCSGNFGFGGTLDGGTEGPERGAEVRSAAAPRGVGSGEGRHSPSSVWGSGGRHQKMTAPRKFLRKSTLKSRIFGSFYKLKWFLLQRLQSRRQ